MREIKRLSGEVIAQGEGNIRVLAEENKTNLWGADLEGADLEGVKNYSESHEVFQEIIRQQKCDTFTNSDWAIVGQIIVHRLCWDTIKNKFGKKAMTVFKKLSACGYREWEEVYKELLEDK
jgi:hypothetical protein